MECGVSDVASNSIELPMGCAVVGARGFDQIDSGVSNQSSAMVDRAAAAGIFLATAPAPAENPPCGPWAFERRG